jgi:hypothetical protein
MREAVRTRERLQEATFAGKVKVVSVQPERAAASSRPVKGKEFVKE